MALQLAPFIWGFIVSVLPKIIFEVLKMLGIGLVTFTGVKLAISELESWVFGQFQGISSDVFSLLVILGIDTGIAMVFSAYAVRATVSALVSSTRMVWNRTSSS